MRTESRGSNLNHQLKTISEKCVNCNLCQKECRFLQKFGKPGEIAAAYDPSNTECLSMPFECSLCALCDAVCPVEIKPSEMFLEMRKESVRRDPTVYGTDCVYLGYETRGTSRHLSYYAFPQHCDTIYFPGCAYPAGRPKETIRLFNFLRHAVPGLGIVLDCCTKPSHDLGRTSSFNAMFGEMRRFLLKHHIKKVLVNCPNCYRIFHTYGRDLKVQTVYEVMAASNLRMNQENRASITVHDPCVIRHESHIHESVRYLLEKNGVHFSEMKHNRKQTICCGEGGSVDCTSPGLANNWIDLRRAEAAGKPMVTYCAGCVNRFGRYHPTTHILDLFFGANGDLNNHAALSRFPLTCINRIRLKNYLKQNLTATITRERTFSHESMGRLPLLNRNRLAYYISMGVAKLLAR